MAKRRKSGRLSKLPIIILILLLIAAAHFLALRSPQALNAAPPPEGMLAASFISVGQGDCTLLQTPSRHTVLIDGGPTDAGGDVCAYLKAAGVETIDLVIATHPHEDHVGGLSAVFAAFPISRVLAPDHAADSTAFSDFLSAVDRERGCSASLAAPGKITLADDPVSMELLWPPEKMPDVSCNDASIVLRVRFKNSTLLLPGDAESLTESRLVDEYPDLSSDVLKVAHHGSATSTNGFFLEAVQPKIAVISCGLGNSYGDPDPATLETLRRFGTRVHRTDREGSITLLSDGEDWTVRE